jgi:ketosteroid isomerase-like protein
MLSVFFLTTILKRRHIMRTKTLIGCLTCIALAFCLYTAPSASAATPEDEVLKVVDNWYKAFNTSDFELMSSVYLQSPQLSEFGPSPEGAFLAQGWEMVEAGWKTTFELPKGTYILSPHNQQVTMIGKDVAIAAQYTIATYTDPSTKKQTIHQVRQTLVFQKIGGKWLIVHQHASDLPTK